MHSRKLPPLSWATTIMLLVAAAVALYAQMGQNFQFLPRGYAQHLYAVSTLKSGSFSLSGTVVLQVGTVTSAECRTTQTKLHIFDPTATFTKNGSALHRETVSPLISGGCGPGSEKLAGAGELFLDV